jgi:hypothetical protein
MMPRPQRRPDTRVSRLGARLSQLGLADLLAFHCARRPRNPLRGLFTAKRTSPAIRGRHRALR